MRFKVGDRVKAVSAPDGAYDLIGETGEVVEIKNVGLPVRVQWDENPQKYRSWWCEESALELDIMQEYVGKEVQR